MLALIVMSVLSLLAISSFELLTASIQIIANHRHDLQAMYIADAGIEDAIDHLRDDPGWSAGLDVEFPTGSGNTYTVSIDNSGYPIIVITSTGTIQNFQRTLEAEVEVIGSSSPYSVVMTYWKEK